jgi:NAD(P)-dependent dehydrogenase (short-subunit alcohol dehydrogenase family)
MSLFDTYRKLYDVKDSLALVAGGGGGIGSAIGEGLAAFGARIVVADLFDDQAEEVAKTIREAGGEASAMHLDVTDVQGMDASIETLCQEVGVPNILINCVGTHKEAPAIDYTEADWDRIFDINLKGAFFLSQSVAKRQIPAGKGGKHIHVTSVRSMLALAGRGYISYCSSKGGMNLMVKQLAVEWAEHNIQVNGIAPTFTRTALVTKYLEDPDFYNPLVARIPLGRVCEPVDLAALAIYLAAPASDFITGQIIFADGGLTATQ